MQPSPAASPPPAAPSPPPGASPPGASPPPPPGASPPGASLPPPLLRPDSLAKIEARILKDLRDPTGLALVHTELPLGYDSAGGATTEGACVLACARRGRGLAARSAARHAPRTP